MPEATHDALVAAVTEAMKDALEGVWAEYPEACERACAAAIRVVQDAERQRIRKGIQAAATIPRRDLDEWQQSGRPASFRPHRKWLSLDEALAVVDDA